MHKLKSNASPPIGKILVLDSTAFYAGVPYTGQGPYYTTDLVIKEVAHRKIKSVSIENLVETGKLKVYDYSKSYLKKVELTAEESGDFSYISKADISVLALALEFKNRGSSVIILSDDYSVENLAEILGLGIVPIMTSGINKVVNWKIYCVGCGKDFQDKGRKVCDICGSSLKRKFKTANNLSHD